jgi:type III pantothenate kinase
MTRTTTQHWLRQHAAELAQGVAALEEQAGLLESWGRRLAAVVGDGGRLLAAGNGGSAAEAQHLTAELVGRFVRERRALSALSLCAESSSVTAILNDYGPDEVFARQVEAHGRPGDVLMLLSTSGRSPNVLAAAERGRACGLRVWALTGPAPNPLVKSADEAVVVPAPSTAAVQEAHLVAVHALCAALDAALDAPAGRTVDLTLQERSEVPA